MDRATALQHLPDRYRLAMEMTEEQRSLTDICRALDIDETALAALVAIGDQKLQRLLDAGAPEIGAAS